MLGAIIPASAAVYHLSLWRVNICDFRVWPQQVKPGELYICLPARRFSAYLPRGLLFATGLLRRFMLSPWVRD